MEDPNSPERNNPFEKWEPKRADIDIGEAVRIYKEWEPQFIQRYRGRGGGWSNEDIRRKIEEEHASLDFAITGEAVVAKGKEPILVLSGPYQEKAAETVFGIHYFVLGGKYYADLEVPEREGQRIKANILILDSVKPPSENHIIISEGLRDLLGVQQGNKIRILDIYQEVSDLDLDQELKR